MDDYRNLFSNPLPLFTSRIWWQLCEPVKPSWLDRMSGSQLGEIVIYLNEQMKLLCLCWLILSLFSLCAVNIPQVLVLENVQKIDTENYHASNTAPSVIFDWLLKLDILWLVALLCACQESDQSSGTPKSVFNLAGKTFFSTPEVLETPLSYSLIRLCLSLPIVCSIPVCTLMFSWMCDGFGWLG